MKSRVRFSPLKYVILTRFRDYPAKSVVTLPQNKPLLLPFTSCPIHTLLLIRFHTTYAAEDSSFNKGGKKKYEETDENPPLEADVRREVYGKMQYVPQIIWDPRGCLRTGC